MKKNQYKREGKKSPRDEKKEKTIVKKNIENIENNHLVRKKIIKNEIQVIYPIN